MPKISRQTHASPPPPLGGGASVDVSKKTVKLLLHYLSHFCNRLYLDNDYSQVIRHLQRRTMPQAYILCRSRRDKR